MGRGRGSAVTGIPAYLTGGPMEILAFMIGFLLVFMWDRK